MTAHLRIEGGVAVERFETDADIATLFPPALIWVEAGAADVGWSYADGVWTAPVAPTVDLAGYAAAKRWAVETGGIVVSGASIATDRESQSLVTGAYVFVQANPSAAVQFKASGGFVTLDAAAVAAIANAVGDHVQACFAAERDLLAAIDAGTVTTTDDIDAWAWPGA